jgi:hypothetical protein
MKEHTDLTLLTEKDLEKFETTCSSEEMDLRANEQVPPLRQQPSANSISSFDQPAHLADDRRHRTLGQHRIRLLGVYQLVG